MHLRAEPCQCTRVSRRSAFLLGPNHIPAGLGPKQKSWPKGWVVNDWTDCCGLDQWLPKDKTRLELIPCLPYRRTTKTLTWISPLCLRQDIQRFRRKFTSLPPWFFFWRFVRQLHTDLRLKTPKYQCQFHRSSQSNPLDFPFKTLDFFSIRRGCYVQRKIDCKDAEEFVKIEV